jgi:hypothetical protein
VDGVGPVASASGPASGKAPPIIIPPPPGGIATGTPTPGGTPPPAGAILGSTTLELCHDTTYWLPTISQWAVPPGCYGQIYAPNPANYPNRPAWGYCNWWVEELHPALPDYAALQLPHRSTPLVGAAMWFAPGEQGASSSGHYAEVVAINPDGYWLLISEMNDAWRGGGFGRVNYRYVQLSDGVTFLY